VHAEKELAPCGGKSLHIFQECGKNLRLAYRTVRHAYGELKNQPSAHSEPISKACWQDTCSL
jgi:hypothetical protein